MPAWKHALLILILACSCTAGYTPERHHEIFLDTMKSSSAMSATAGSKTKLYQLRIQVERRLDLESFGRYDYLKGDDDFLVDVGLISNPKGGPPQILVRSQNDDWRVTSQVVNETGKSQSCSLNVYQTNVVICISIVTDDSLVISPVHHDLYGFIANHKVKSIHLLQSGKAPFEVMCTPDWSPPEIPMPSMPVRNRR